MNIQFWLILALSVATNYVVRAQSLENLALDSLIRWVDANMYDDDGQKVFRYAHLARYRAQQAGNAEWLGDIHEHLATWHFSHSESGNRDSIFYYDRQALEYYLKTDNLKKQASAYLHVGTNFAELQRYRQAQEYTLQGIRLLEKINDRPGLARAYADMCYVCREMGAHEDAIRYCEQSIATYKSVNRADDVVVPLLYLIMAHTNNGQADIAITRANEAIALIEKNGGQEADPGGTLKAFGSRGRAYEALGQYDKALADYTYAWNFAKSVVPEPHLADGYKGDIGNILRLQGKYAEAIPYLEANIQHASNHGLREMVWENYLQTGECHQKIGNLSKALDYLQTGWMLRDSMRQNRVAALDSELQIQYETEKREATIAGQQQLIAQQKRVQWLTFGMLGLLALVAGVIFFAYRSNQRINRQLAKKNKENELLLKEIHHRVKNNLQVISSLLSLQSAQIQDDIVLDAMRESQNRVRSMALIHQKLYQGENLAAVEMRDYLSTLGESVLDSFGVDSDTVQVKTPMENIELDVDTAIPIGLIVNELVTNSMKYAFAGKRRGEIEISLRQASDDQLQLVVADSGGEDPPAAAAAPAEQGTGFGSQLVQLLTMQLNGQLETRQERGRITILRFATNANKAA